MTFTSAMLTERMNKEAFWTTGVNLGFTSANDRWNARLWVKNLGNEEILLDGFDFGTEAIAFPGAPRQIGASLSYRF